MSSMCGISIGWCSDINRLPMETLWTKLFIYCMCEWGGELTAVERIYAAFRTLLNVTARHLRVPYIFPHFAHADR
jgi:hypothetical protein